MVLIEAMAVGMPVVSTNCPNGPFEVLKGGELGSLVPVGDLSALTEAILGVLEGRVHSPMIWISVVFKKNRRSSLI